MAVTKEETLGLQAIFVNRADILNGIRIKLDIIGKSKVTLNTAVIKNNVINNKTVNE